MEEKKTFGSRLADIWNKTLNLKGDKVIVIIVLLLILISFLAIFSSTPLLPSQESRLGTMRDHGLVALFGIGLMILLYHFEIKWLKYLSQIGFILSFIMLSMLMLKVDFGFIRAETINGATRNFSLFGMQIHVFEIVKVAMVMYLAWAVDTYKRDQADIAEGKESKAFTIINKLSEHEKLGFLKKPFWKRAV